MAGCQAGSRGRRRSDLTSAKVSHKLDGRCGGPRQYHHRSASRYALRPWWTLVHKGLLQAGVSNLRLIVWQNYRGGPQEKDIAMKIPKPHRGVAYSVADNRNGTWRWKLHPKLVPYTSILLISGRCPEHRMMRSPPPKRRLTNFLR